MSIETIGIVGGGTMGSGIAEVAARAQVPVTLVEVSAEQLEAAQKRIGRSLDKAVERGKLAEDDREAALGRLDFDTDLDAVAGVDLVIEAVVESLEIKRSIFESLDRIVQSGDAILASNTSSIPIIDIAGATGRPDSVVGMHFFNPVPVMKLVEIVSSVATSDATRERAAAFASERLGKTVVHAPDRGGFIVNRLLVPYLTEAIRMVEGSHATPEDIDRGMELGAAHPMGPLALCDLVGNDVILAVGEALFEEYKEPLYAPPPLLRRMVAGGLLGRKSGRGFYQY